MTSGFSARREQSGSLGFVMQPLRRPNSACPMKPSILPPPMSAVAAASPCGPPALRSRVSWNGSWQPPLAGSGTHTAKSPSAARAWIDAWSQSWRELDAERLEPVYAANAVHRSHPFREPGNPIEYARWGLSEEEGEPEVWMGEPIVSGDRAAIEWWASVIEHG